MESIIRIFNDFIKISLFFFFIYYIFSTEGCECVPGMDTPREVTPSFDAFVLFINAIPDINDINIYTDKNILKKQLEYSGEDYQYIKVPPGNRNIRVTNWADSVLYNTVIELRDKENY